MRPRTRISRLLLCVTFAALFVAGIAAETFRLRASQLAGAFDLRSADRAIHLAPGNAGLWLLRAELRDQAAVSGSADIRNALELNPLDASAWIRLGIDAEASGDFATAEAHLLQAARVSRLFQPRWTLANYYLRRGVPDGFWRWTKLALELAPREPQPLFDLAWRMSDNPDEILKRAIPDVRRVSRNYVRYLLASDRVEAARGAALRLLRDVEFADREPLLGLCDHLVDGQRFSEALATWNAMRPVLPFEPLDPERGRSLTNGGFAIAGPFQGFNWRVENAPGVTYKLGGGSAAVYFSGTQPESADTLWQVAPVVPGRSYRLQLEYRTEGAPEHSGLRWIVTAGNAPAASDHLSASEWRAASVHFTTRPEDRFVRLALRYARTRGSVRWQGSIRTRNMQLTLQP